jgi:hypothetical protein
MRYVALNATKSATIDKDVKRTYVVRLLNSSLFYIYCASFLRCIMPCLFLHCIMPCLFLHSIMSLLFVFSLVLTHFLTFGRMEHLHLLLEEKYAKDH